MKHQTPKTTPYFIELHVGSQTERLPILVRKRAGARSMVIRYQPIRHALSLTLPRYASIRQGLHFVEERREWIAQQLKKTARHVPFTEGQLIPVMGGDYVLAHAGGRGVIRMEEGRILVPGEVEFMARRVREWLKKLATETISELAREKAAQIGMRCGRITVRDTSSRWGSCSHDGNLSFSWRLILAPREVLHYLVCHEVAHLEEFNHSPAFWKLVGRLDPDYKAAQKWLKSHSATLYAYG